MDELQKIKNEIEGMFNPQAPVTPQEGDRAPFPAATPPPIPAMNPEVIAKLQAMADQEAESNQIREMANIGSSMAEQIGGLQKGNRLSLDDGAKSKLQEALLKSGMPGKQVGGLGGSGTSGELGPKDMLNYQMERLRQAGYKNLTDTKEQGKGDRQDKSHENKKKMADINQDNKKDFEKIKQGERDIKEFRNITKEFESFSGVGKARQSAKQGDMAIALLEMKNPIMDKAIRPFMARLTGEVGNLTESEQAVFGGSQELKERIQQAAKTWVGGGELTDENRKLLLEAAAGMRDAQLGAIKDAAGLYATRMADERFSADDIYERITRPAYKVGKGNKAVKQAEKEGKVMIRLKDGRVGKIPKENVEKALSSGATLIEE